MQNNLENGTECAQQLCRQYQFGGKLSICRADIPKYFNRLEGGLMWTSWSSVKKNVKSWSWVEESHARSTDVGSGGEKVTLQRRPEGAGGQLEPQPAVCPWSKKRANRILGWVSRNVSQKPERSDPSPLFSTRETTFQVLCLVLFLPVQERHRHMGVRSCKGPQRWLVGCSTLCTRRGLCSAWRKEIM